MNKINARMLEVQKKLVKLDKTCRGDYEFWEQEINDGRDVEALELEEAERYLSVLLEGNDS